MTTKTKIILLVLSAVLLLVIGGVSGWLLTKNYYKPTPIKPGQSTVTIIRGEPGSIMVSNELFYNDYLTAEITSTGEGFAKYTLMRPERWMYKPKNHFLGVGIMVGLVNSDFLYGGFILYRYRIINDFSIITELHLIMNKQYRYDAGLKFGVEFGIK
jgi:hypothetical protein